MDIHQKNVYSISQESYKCDAMKGVFSSVRSVHLEAKKTYILNDVKCVFLLNVQPIPSTTTMFKTMQYSISLTALLM